MSVTSLDLGMNTVDFLINGDTDSNFSDFTRFRRSLSSSDMGCNRGGVM